MKKTLLVVAVAATMIAPLAMADSKLVGSLRYGIGIAENGKDLVGGQLVETDTEFAVQNWGSRIKWSGDADLDNGMNSFGQIELRLSDTRNGAVVNRLYRVGVKGGFGSVSVGVQDSAFDLVNRDRTWWNGASGLVGNRSEKNGVLKYENNFGDVAVAVAATMQAGDDDADVADIIDAGILYSANGISAGVGVQSLAGNGNPVVNDGTAFAVTGGYDFGAGDIQLTYGVEDEDYAGRGADLTGIYLEAGFGDAYVWYGQKEVDAKGANTPTGLGIGYTQKLGPQTLIWYELFQNDPDDTSDADIGFNAALKIDF